MMSFLDSPKLEFTKILYSLELTVKECKVIFYTFDFLSTGSDDDDDDDDDPKIFFKSTKNRVCNSQWVGGHRYTRILLASKLLWE